jgi:hypothetical protein
MDRPRGRARGAGTFVSPCCAAHLRVQRRRPHHRDGGLRRILEGNKAHGRIGRCLACNGQGTSRTHRRSKALKSGTPSEPRGRRRPVGLRRRSWDAIREGRRPRVQRRSSPTSVGGGGLPGDGSALLLNGTLGRSGLRSRGTTPIRCEQATSDRDLDAEDHRLARWSHFGGRGCVARHPRPGSRRVEGCRGDVGAHPGGPEHHHHGQGSTLFSRHRSRCHPTTSVGRDDASWHTSVYWPLPSVRSRVPPLFGRAVEESRRRCAQASELLPSRAVASPWFPRPTSVRGCEQRRRPGHPRLQAQPLRRLRWWSRIQGESGRAGLTRGKTTSVRIPAVGSREAIVTRCGLRRHTASAVGLRVVERGGCGGAWSGCGRQEGNGRGDAVRLLTRGILRGV